MLCFVTLALKFAIYWVVKFSLEGKCILVFQLHNMVGIIKHVLDAGLETIDEEDINSMILNLEYFLKTWVYVRTAYRFSESPTHVSVGYSSVKRMVELS
ncbi:hypothetical protein VNO77_40208 [Canavalia gladiata]|uniref:Uncharacterized protein n=1 Tax=Canavalia gladiata TaxID=3824 RepID=A0AAN9JY48_CANGL